jgi:hypothetical protein
MKFFPRIGHVYSDGRIGGAMLKVNYSFPDHWSISRNGNLLHKLNTSIEVLSSGHNEDIILPWGELCTVRRIHFV